VFKARGRRTAPVHTESIGRGFVLMMIRVLTKKELHRAKSLAQEYLGADLGRFSVMFEAYPELFIGVSSQKS